MFFSMNHTLITVLFLDQTFPFYTYTVCCSPCCQPNTGTAQEVQLVGAFLAHSALSAYTGSNACEINTLSVFLNCILKCNVAPGKQKDAQTPLAFCVHNLPLPGVLSSSVKDFMLGTAI